MRVRENDVGDVAFAVFVTVIGTLAAALMAVVIWGLVDLIVNGEGFADSGDCCCQVVELQ